MKTVKSRILAIGIALLVAVAGAAVVIGYANRADQRAVAGQQVERVYFAAKDVPAGTSAKNAVDRGLMTLQKVVAKGVPGGAMRTLPADPSGVVALDQIMAGEIVLGNRFGSPTAVTTQTGVPAGMVAVSVDLSMPAAAKAYLRKGVHVAIYDSFNARSSSGTPKPNGAHLTDDKTSLRATGVVLPDVVVLDVASTSSNSSSANSSSSPTSGPLMVTLAVKPSDAARVVHAIQTGDLYAVVLGQGASVGADSTATDNSVVGK